MYGASESDIAGAVENKPHTLWLEMWSDKSRNRNLWKLGIMDNLIVGRDRIVRAAKIRAGKGVIERAVQHLYPLDLSVDRTPKVNLDPTIPPFKPKRVAAVIAKERIQEIAQEEDESSDV